MFLHGIICQMNKLILQICGIEFLGTGSYIALLVPVALHITIDRSDHHKTPEIEFPLFK